MPQIFIDPTHADEPWQDFAAGAGAYSNDDHGNGGNGRGGGGSGRGSHRSAREREGESSGLGINPNGNGNGSTGRSPVRSESMLMEDEGFRNERALSAAKEAIEQELQLRSPGLPRNMFRSASDYGGSDAGSVGPSPSHEQTPRANRRRETEQHREDKGKSPAKQNGGDNNKRASRSTAANQNGNAAGGSGVPRHQVFNPKSALDPDSLFREVGGSGGDAGGGYGDDDARSIKSGALAGSRPPTRSGGRDKKRTLSVTSAATSVAGGGKDDKGYLYLHNQPPGASRPTVIHPGRIPRANRGSRSQETSGGIDGRIMSIHGSIGGISAGDRLSRMAPLGQQQQQPHQPPLPNGTPTDIRYTGTSENFGPQQAWYFLRALVGMELQWESERLWRMDDLEPRAISEHDEDTASESQLSIDDDVDFNPGDLPIMRYLIKNFLLTMPLVRDTQAGLPADGGQVHSFYGTENVQGIAGMPVFWTQGLLPLLRSLNERDLSQPADRNQRSIWSILYGIYTSHSLERFVSAGLKISSSGSANAANADFSRTGSVLNPLRNVEVPGVPKSPPNNQNPLPSRRDSTTKPKRFSSMGSFFMRGKSKGRPESETAEYLESPISPRMPLPPRTTSPIPVPVEEPVRSRKSSHRAREENSQGTDGGATEVVREGVNGTGIVPHQSGEMSEEASSENHRFDLSPTPPAVPTSSPAPDGKRKSNIFAFFNRHSTDSEAEIQSPTTDDGAHRASGETERQGAQTSTENHDFPPERPSIDESRDTHGHYTDAHESAEGYDVSPVTDNRVRIFNDDKQDDNQTERLQPGLESRPPPTPASFQTSAGFKTPEPGEDHFFAAMALPSELDPNNYQPPGSVPLNGSSSRGGSHPSRRSKVKESRQPFSVPLVPKEGHKWPWGAPVPFWKGTPVHRVEWGGFEVDVIGVRRSLFDHAFVIRVRRPSRLDEYVVRSEAQFRKYLSFLDKEFPSTHVRRLPQSNIKPEEDKIGSIPARGSKRGSMVPPSPGKNRFAAELQDVNASGDISRRASSKRGTKGESLLMKSLRDAAFDSTSNVPSRQNTFRRRSTSLSDMRQSTTFSPSAPSMLDMQKLPPYDPQRRALRAWLRDTLAIRTIGHHKETAAFLLLGATRPKDKDVKDFQKRLMIDDARRQSRMAIAQSAAERARVMFGWWKEVESEMINGDGFIAFSEALRSTPKFDDLDNRWQKAAEWMRYDLAQALYDLLVTGEHSTRLLSAFKQLHAAFPWFLVRQALKLPRSSMMANALADILLRKRFSGKSLLQKILSATLDDDPMRLHAQKETCRARIQSPTMCEKLQRFVYAPAEVKRTIRKHAADNGLELVVTIVRGADEPRLDRYDLDRIIRASKTYRNFLKKNPTPLARALIENPNIRLIVDLQTYLRLLSEERDSAEIRNMLAEESTAEALEVIVSPFLEFLKRTYRHGNASSAILDLQKFLDQLIIIVDALRARIQDPQKSVRVLARLLSRHQQPLYSYIHEVHKQDTIIEEFLQWGWTAAVFLRRGLAETLNLDAVLPEDGEDKAYLLDEIEDLVEYHGQKRMRAYEKLCRRYAADVDGDDPVIVEGDGQGKSRVEPLLEPEPRAPRLVEIPRCLESFRQQIKHIFAV